jgi:hypothetical protein
MSYLIKPVDEDRCVFLSYEGETPAVELSAARRETDAMLDQRQWHRLVVDVTHLQSLPRTSEILGFASGLSSTVSRARRVAVVIRPEQERQASLFQRAARRGRFFLTCFVDPAKAAHWVKQFKPDRQAQGLHRRETM